MKQADVKAGKTYAVMVSGRLSPVRIILIRTRDPITDHRMWGALGSNQRTGRDVEIRSAQRLRFEVVKGTDGKWHRVGGDA